MPKRVELEEAEVNYLSQVLMQRPFAEVNNLIVKIAQQMNDQAFQGKLEMLEKELFVARKQVTDLLQDKVLQNYPPG